MAYKNEPEYIRDEIAVMRFNQKMHAWIQVAFQITFIVLHILVGVPPLVWLLINATLFLSVFEIFRLHKRVDEYSDKLRSV